MFPTSNPEKSANVTCVLFGCMLLWTPGKTPDEHQPLLHYLIGKHFSLSCLIIIGSGGFTLKTTTPTIPRCITMSSNHIFCFHRRNYILCLTEENASRESWNLLWLNQQSSLWNITFTWVTFCITAPGSISHFYCMWGEKSKSITGMSLRYSTQHHSINIPISHISTVFGQLRCDRSDVAPLCDPQWYF